MYSVVYHFKAKDTKVFHFGSNLRKKVPNHSPEHILFRWILLLRIFFRDLSEGENVSDIKPPLKSNRYYEKLVKTNITLCLEYCIISHP